LIEKQPFGFAHMLEAADLYFRGPTEIVLVGDRSSAEFRAWIDRAGLLYVPNRALFVADPMGGSGFLPEQARGKPQVNGQLTAYVCRERTCSPPMTTFEAVIAALDD
jgi:hypothetical protein